MIEMKNLTKDFGAVHAVRDLSLDIPTGELFCFLGPNGAGKTTTIKMLVGLLRPTSGSIRIAGIDVRQDPVAAKRLIGYIPDMPFLYEQLTAEEFFRFAGDLYNVPKAEVDKRLVSSFTQFALMEHRNVLVKDYSHGMRQRLIYCATFLHDPTVVFIDEPLMGLDPYTIRLIKTMLVAKARAGATIFLTTHILALAQDIADRIGIILDGRLVALGTLRQLAQQSGITGSLEDVFLSLTGASIDEIDMKGEARN
jgi:ABC-2 type transport system ATP-binding protein